MYIPKKEAVATIWLIFNEYAQLSSTCTGNFSDSSFNLARVASMWACRPIF